MSDRRAVFPPSSRASNLSDLLDSTEIAGLIRELEALRWTGRKGYPVRALVGACLAKALYAIPTWTRTAALVAEHASLREACGAAPSVYALYRFAAKLRSRKPLLDACLDSVAASLRANLPDYGRDVAIDASDMPAYANGQRFVSKGGRERERFSDPDASWGHRSAISTRRGGGFYGYKLHAAICARTGLPLAFRVESANHHEARTDTRRRAGLRTRTLDVRRGRRQARADEVALPLGRVRAEVDLAQGRPA